MVPRQLFHQLKPNSGVLQGIRRGPRKEISREAHFDAQKNRIQFDDGEKRDRLWQRCVPFITMESARNSLTYHDEMISLSSSSRCERNSRTSLGASKCPATPLARRPTEKASPPISGMIANTLSSVTSSPIKNGRRPLNGSCLINSITPLALVKPECLISHTSFPGSTSIGAFGRSARINDTAA